MLHALQGNLVIIKSTRRIERLEELFWSYNWLLNVNFDGQCDSSNIHLRYDDSEDSNGSEDAETALARAMSGRRERKKPKRYFLST